jgi:hypothetical protein
MENSQNIKEKPQPNDLMRWVQTILLAIITATLIGFFTKMQDLNDRLIRIEVRAEANTAKINSMQETINRVEMKQLTQSDRLTRLEYQIEEISKK